LTWKIKNVLYCKIPDVNFIFSQSRLFDGQLAYQGKLFMASTLPRMTPEQLKEMIVSLIEQKLLELIGDPDEGLPVRRSLINRLQRQKQSVDRGERGELFTDVVKRLGLT
jgi:hypothetical protein